MKIDRMKYWLAVGAQPSDTVARLLGHVGVLPPPPIRFQPQKSQPRKAPKAFSTLAPALLSSSTSVSSASSRAGVFAGAGLVSAAVGRPVLGLRPAFMVAPLGASLGFGL